MHAEDRKTYSEWRPLMDPVRAVVWDEVKRGTVEVTQKGEVRPWEMRNDLKGPIRVKRGSKWGERDEEKGKKKKEEEEESDEEEADVEVTEE
jgi:hypothetical protein